jgi:hypothetical protein
VRFEAPWDRTLRIATWAVVAILGSIAVALAILVPRAGEGGTILAGIVIALLAVTVGLAWGLAPRGYAIDAGRLRIERPLRAVEIPLAFVRSAARLPDGALRR